MYFIMNFIVKINDLLVWYMEVRYIIMFVLKLDYFFWGIDYSNIFCFNRYRVVKLVFLSVFS